MVVLVEIMGIILVMVVRVEIKEGSPLVGFGVLVKVGLWFAEEGVDDLELFWGEDFAGAGVAGGLEGGHEWFVGVDFVGEAFARTLLTFGDVA
jgi:hypothetical protein